MRVVFGNTTKKGCFLIYNQKDFICVTNPVHALKPEAVLMGRRTFAFACSLSGGGAVLMIALMALSWHRYNN